jgi:hypothetical protein
VSKLEMLNYIFEWIVTSLNVALDQKTEDVLFIGVLGIFGFERFERNDSEQLLVNYTNEVLQATFNSQVYCLVCSCSPRFRHQPLLHQPSLHHVVVSSPPAGILVNYQRQVANIQSPIIDRSAFQSPGIISKHVYLMRYSMVL